MKVKAMNPAPQAERIETTKMTAFNTRSSWGDDGAESTVIVSVTAG